MEGWTTILMAAGTGVRMHSSMPKVLHCVAGVPMLRHTATAALDVNRSSPLIVVSPKSHEAIAHEMGDEFEYVIQPEPLGTGNALSTALDRVPFHARHIVLLNGDMPLISGDDLRLLSETHLSHKAAITVGIAVLPVLEAGDLGTLRRGARGKPVGITEAVERSVTSGSTAEVAAGAFAIDASWVRGAVDYLPKHGSGEYFVTDLVGIAVADGLRVETVILDSLGACIGVNTRAQLAKAEHAMQVRLRQHALDVGVTMTDPATVYLDAMVDLSPDVTILPNTTLAGNTTAGQGAVIGPNTQIRDSAIGDGAVIESSVIRSSRIEANVRVGPFTLIREGSYLDDGAYIGAHAEIKASRVGKGSHVGHFSYIGDAVLGDKVNIGAGTVTCNYDGSSKHVTQIGDGAFIGSGSMLVAPITIGSRALTAAGAVVNKDVGPGERVAGVPARTMYQRPQRPRNEEERPLG